MVTYDFSFTKTKIILLITALIVMGLLIFASGWICGKMVSHYSAPPDNRDAISDKPAASGTLPNTGRAVSDIGRNAATIANMPNMAVSDVSRTAGTITAMPGRAVSDTNRAIRSGLQPSPSKAVSAPQPATSKNMPETPKSESSQSDNQEKNNGEKNAQTQETQNTKSGIMYAVEADSFAVQSKASALVKSLMPKGYKAEVLKMQSPEETGSALYVVLIGVYDDLKKASDAASEFKKKEGMAAVVRPIAANILEESRKSSATPAVTPEGDSKSRK